MPNGLPEASSIWEGDVSFFSIDTDLIQSAGYNFTAGILHQLPAKMPARMCLQLTEVVVREIISHRMEPVLKALQPIESAAREIQRLSLIDMTTVTDEINNKNVVAESTSMFRKAIVDYSEKCNGGILPIEGADLSANMFERYFQNSPPFGLRKDKKSEFPDAASLLLLEQYAKNNRCYGIIASGDKGAAEFANTSDFIYCVSSLDELAALFVATDEHAMKIKARIDTALLDENSHLRSVIETSVDNHVSDSNWTVDEIYSGTVSNVEGDVYQYQLKEYEIHITEAEIWESKTEAGTWIIDLDISAQVEVGVDVTFRVWDPIDREEVSLGSQPYHITTEINFKIYLSCSGITPDNDPEDWETSIDIARGDYSVDVGEVEPDFGDDPNDYN